MYRTPTSQGREYSVYFNIVFHLFLARFKNVLLYAHNWNINAALTGLTNGLSNTTFITGNSKCYLGRQYKPIMHIFYV